MTAKTQTHNALLSLTSSSKVSRFSVTLSPYRHACVIARKVAACSHCHQLSLFHTSSRSLPLSSFKSLSVTHFFLLGNTDQRAIFSWTLKVQGSEKLCHCGMSLLGICVHVFYLMCSEQRQVDQGGFFWEHGILAVIVYQTVCLLQLQSAYGYLRIHCLRAENALQQQLNKV